MANVASDDAQQEVGFTDKVTKEIIVEAPTDHHRRPSPGDVVTVRVAEKAVDAGGDLHTWTVGAVAAETKVVSGVDLDQLVRTMRCSEQCSAFAKGAEEPTVVIATLVGLERAEDLTADGRLLRTTIREGAGWQVPRPGTELKVRFSWRAVLDSADVATDVEACPEACRILLAGDAGAEAATSRELYHLRRELRRHLKGSPEVLTQIEASAPTVGAVLRVSHGSTMLLDAPNGVSVEEALAKVQAALGAQAPSACREAREVLMQVETSSSSSTDPDDKLGLLELTRGQGSVVCSAEDWIPGAAGVLALSDLRKSQHCFVRVQADLAFGTSGLPDFGILPNTTLEYEIEVLAIMTFEDASLDKSKLVMKKIVKEGEGYERPEEGAEVTVSCEAHDGDSGAVLFEEQTLVFVAANGKFCSALEETVLTMKKGEVCEVRCSAPSAATDPELGLSPGASSVVVFCLELKDFEKITLHQLSEADRVAHCGRRKEAGAKFFKDSNWLRALKRYQHAATQLRYLDHWMDEEAKIEALKLRRVSYTNAAACLLKLEAWEEAVSACGNVLKEEQDNVKALFRRGHALLELGQHREAALDLRRVLELDRENAQAGRLLAKAKQAMKAEVANEKKIYSKMCGGGPKSPSATDKAAAPARTVETKQNVNVGEDVDVDDGEDSCGYIVGAAALLTATAVAFLWSKGHLRGRIF